MPGTRLAERLQDLLLENDVLEDFLRQLSACAAEFAAAETGRMVLCSVRLARRRRPVALAASNPEALVLDSLQDGLAEGPGLETRKTRQAVLVPDTTMDPRWRRYQRAVAQRGYRSVLAVPLLEDREAAATLTFFSTSPDAFDDGALAACESLAVRAANVLRLAVRFESAQGLN
ncbi:GAF domain-containing protein, partial [uncultured Arthrobacter sp.]|uniref:GAF domain-containing protein n=1 Tax=uncultured Arthrobacter sp. TaxID=114050 RepID=UPI003217A4B1